MKVLVAALCCAAALVLQQAPAAEGHLKVGYYDTKCRGVENVVKYHVHKAIKANRKNGAALVRLIFHDCFVRVRRRPYYFAEFLLPCTCCYIYKTALPLHTLSAPAYY
jgi:hypothetical protein